MSNRLIDKILYKIGSMLYNTDFVLKSQTMDLSKTNNGVGSMYYPCYQVTDKDNRIVARLEAVVNPNGANGVQMYARNYDTEGTLKGQHGIRVEIDKNGGATWVCTPSFCTVIKVSLGSHAFAGSTTTSFNLWSYVTAQTPSGYTPIGIVGYSTNHGSVVMVSARLVNSIYSFEARNIATGQVTTTPEVYVLYFQTGLQV